MILYPAIDIRGGQAVRLLEGDYAKETIYDADPVDAARRWAGEGAEFLHVVDLDGAKAGAPQNLDVIARIVAAVDCPVQVGGGLRDDESVRAVLEGANAQRAVIGTAALRDRNFLQTMVNAYADRIVVSVDTRDSKVALSGWTESSDVEAVDVIAELGRRGVARFLCTAIEMDGTMEGPAIDQLAEIAAATTASVIASGGVGTLDHLTSLSSSLPALDGAIVGRALYEQRFTVSEAIAALRR